MGGALGLPQTLDPANNNPLPGLPNKELSPPAPYPKLVPNTKSSFPSATSTQPPHCEAECWIQADILSRPIFMLSKLTLQPPSHPQRCSFTPQYGTLSVSTCIINFFFFFIFSFFRYFQGRTRGGGEGNFLITVVVLLCPMHQ